MNSRILIAAVTALALGAVSSADAGTKHKRHRVARHGPPAVTYVPAPEPAYRTRPVWAQPGQCFEDQGYGRFIPCGSAPSVR